MLAFLFSNIFYHLLFVWRWDFILKKNGINIPFGTLLRYQFIGVFFLVLLPSSLGSDVAKFALVNEKGRGAETVNSLFIARIAGIFALLLLAIPGTFIFPFKDVNIVRWILVGILFISLAGIGLIKYPFFNMDKLMKWKWMEKPRKILKNLRHNMNLTLLGPVFWMSLGINLISGIAFYFSFLAIRVDISFSNVFLITPIITTLSAVIPTVLGIGPREAGFQYFFGTALGTKELLGSLSILINLLLFMQVFIGLFFWITLPGKKK